MASVSSITSTNDDNQVGSLSFDLRVAAIFVLMLFGSAGVSTPLLTTRFTRFRSNSFLFMIGKAFGAGVVISTAYIHILPSAQDLLEEVLSTDYPVSGALALSASIFVLALEQWASHMFMLLRKRAESTEPLLDKPVNGSSKEAVGEEVMSPVQHRGHAHDSHVYLGATSNPESFIIAHVLEFGIAIHSIIIGMALGASTDPDTVESLMMALTFHQFFEGIALGVSVAEAELPCLRQCIMVAIFSTTAPMGIAIGLGLSLMNTADSRQSLLTQGILDSFSGGILIYMALVDMVSEDFKRSLLTRRPHLRYYLLLSVFLGALAMAIIGLWA